MISAAEAWLAVNRENEPVKSNLTKLVQWHPNGIAGYIFGIAVLS